MDARPDTAALGRRRARRRVLGLGGLATVVALTLAGAGLAWAGFGGQLANSTGTFSTGTLLLGGVTPVGVSCTSSSTVAPISTNSATCPGDPLPTGTLSPAGSAATTTLSEPGTIDPTAAAVSSTCGVAQLRDDESHDTALAMGGVSYGQSGPLGGTGIALDGSSGWFESTAPYSTPGSFTLLAWFKAAPGASGTIFSLSSSQFDTGSPDSDLDLWIDGSGQLVWGVVTLTALGDPLPSETTSTGAVTDGTWHLAAATFAGPSSTLYLDGTAQGSVPALSGVASQNGWYPAVGWGPEGAPTWLNGPPSGFFAGTLSMVSLSPVGGHRGPGLGPGRSGVRRGLREHAQLGRPADRELGDGRFWDPGLHRRRGGVGRRQHGPLPARSRRPCSRSRPGRPAAPCPPGPARALRRPRPRCSRRWPPWRHSPRPPPPHRYSSP